jgi:hypothetical protein
MKDCKVAAKSDFEWLFMSLLGSKVAFLLGMSPLPFTPSDVTSSSCVTNTLWASTKGMNVILAKSWTVYGILNDSDCKGI